jgi:hypothetical protein
VQPKADRPASPVLDVSDTPRITCYSIDIEVRLAGSIDSWKELALIYSSGIGAQGF